MLLGCGTTATGDRFANRAPPPADPLPLVKGATFSYDVTIEGGGKPQRFAWTMTVVEATGAGPTTYKLSGWPDQLVDFEDGPPAPRIKLLIRSFDNFVWGSDVHAVPWFTWPVFDGQRICPDPASRYCWTVAVDHGRYRLTFHTNPDDVTYELTPGVGLTRYTYHHHGSPLTIDAKLVGHR